MAQVLKPEMKSRIHGAALEVFLEQGFRGASMQAIARRAGVSVGNLYRYHRGKEELFLAVVPPDKVEGMFASLARRLEAAGGAADLDALGAEAPYWSLFREQMGFLLENRRLAAILLLRSGGTRYQGFPEALLLRIKALVREYLASLGRVPGYAEELEPVLDLVYRRLLEATAEVLAGPLGKEEAGRVLTGYLRYHLSGLKGLFGFDDHPAARDGEGEAG